MESNEFLVLAENLRLLNLRFLALDSILEDLEPILHVKYASKFNQLSESDKALKEIREKLNS